MTIFFRSHFCFNNFFQKTFQGYAFQNRSYVSKTTPKFLSAEKER